MIVVNKVASNQVTILNFNLQIHATKSAIKAVNFLHQNEMRSFEEKPI